MSDIPPRTSSVGRSRLRAHASRRTWRSSRLRVRARNARVPVPVVAAVVAEAHVLGQPVELAGPRPVRLVGGDGVGHLVERGEAVGALAHERPDLVGPGDLQPRRDVDEHERGGVDVVLADGDEARAAAHRRADEHRARRAELLEHGDEVLDLGVLRVVAVGGPVRVAVAAGIEGDGAVAGLGQRLAGALPRVAGLAAAVLQHDDAGRRGRPMRRRRCASPTAAPTRASDRGSGGVGHRRSCS